MVRVFLAAIAVLALAACTNPTAGPADGPTAPRSAMPTSGEVPSEPADEPTTREPAPAPGNPKTATVRAVTDGPASITFTEDGVEKAREDITGPWERTIEVTNPPTELELVVEADSSGGTVGCEIKSDRVDVNNMSSGGSVSATCTTTVS